MCGISSVKLVDKRKDAFDLVAAILDKQSHRGTSSTGIGYFEDGQMRIVKDIISPHNFKTKFNNLRTGSTVVGHNRMPSCGAVTLPNAHPFFSCDKSFMLLHNGSENMDMQRKLLKKLGHNIEGETDSEVICHLLEEHLSESGSMLKAMQELKEEIGYSTIIVMMNDGQIYGFGRSLYIIRDENGIYMASEEESFVPLFEGQKKTIYDPTGIVRVSADGKLFFTGGETHEKKKIEKETRSKYTFYNDDDDYKPKHKSEPADQDRPYIDDFDDEYEEIVEAERNKNWCTCSESETDFGSRKCNHCGKITAES